MKLRNSGASKLWRRCISDDGAALIIVTWLTFVLSLVALGLMALTLSQRQALESISSDTRDKLLVQAAIEIFFRKYFYDPDEEVYRNASFDIDGVSIDIIVQFEDGKVNINRAGIPMLSALFASKGLSHAQAISLAESIVDWRDMDDVALPNGGEYEAYQSAGSYYLPRNGPFETLGEVRRVAGMSESLFQCVRRLMTPYSLVSDLRLQGASEQARDILKWAYENNWFDEVWPDPELVSDSNSFADITEIGGKAMTVIVRLDNDPAQAFLQVVRFKSISDRSFSKLTPIRRVYELAAPNSCFAVE